MIIEAIVAALSAGAVSGATDVAKKAIVDGYSGMKSLITKKFGGDSTAASAIKMLEVKPDSGDIKQILGKELESINASSDPELTKAAQDLLELVRTLPQGEKHVQYAQGTGIAQADRGSTATVTYYAPPKDNE